MTSLESFNGTSDANVKGLCARIAKSAGVEKVLPVLEMAFAGEDPAELDRLRLNPERKNRLEKWVDYRLRGLAYCDPDHGNPHLIVLFEDEVTRRVVRWMPYEMYAFHLSAVTAEATA